MLRSTRPLLTASAQGLRKGAAPIGSATPLHTRRYASGKTWRPSALATTSSRQLVPFVQRAQFAAKNEPDVKFEKEVAKKKLESDPEHVTSDSSVRQFEGPGERLVQQASTSEGLVGDLNRLSDAVALHSVPPLSYRLGFAGTIPYFATSLATVYCSWNLNTEWPSQSQFLNHIMMSHEQASHYLHLLEPLQVGYGAAIISFLGAIHWGLEYAEKTPNKARTNFRYGLGVLAPVIAWPTVMLPIQFALTTQFAAFIFMYFADARATTRGWAPQWYGTYRFVLTMIVGSALLVSLIGREKVGADQPRLTGLREKFHKEGHDVMAQHEWEKEEAKEKEKIHKQKAEEEKKKKKEEEKAKKEEAKKPKSGKKDSGKESKDSGKEDSEDKGKDENKDEDKGDSKDEGKDEGEGQEDQGKDDSKDEGKDDSKDESGDDSKDEGKDDSKNDSKDEGKDSNKDDEKDESKDRAKSGDDKKDKKSK